MSDKLSPVTPGTSNQPIQVYNVTPEQASHQLIGNQRFQLSDYEPRSPAMEELDIAQTWRSHATGEESNQIMLFLENFSQKRKDVTGGHKGTMYEIELIMLLILEGMRRKADGRINRFMLGSNMDNVGNFHHIVFEYTFNHNGREKRKLIFLQARHRDEEFKKYTTDKVTETKLLSGKDRDFNLQKCIKPFLKIKDHLSEFHGRAGTPIFGNLYTHEDIDFVIFSSAQSSFSTNIRKHNGDQSFVVKEIIDEDSILCLSKTTECNCYYRLDSDKDRHNKIFDALQDSSKMTPDKDTIQHFLNKLKLFLDQPDEDELEHIIKDKIQTESKVPRKYVKNIFLNFKSKVVKWWEKGKEPMSHTEVEKIFQKAGRINICFHVKLPIDTFTGRKKELHSVHGKLQRSTEATTVVSQMTSISGLGGIGKTELARRYVKDYIADYYDGNGIWINAESEGTLEMSFRKLAIETLEIRIKDTNGEEKQTESIVNKVYEYFEKRKCLFIFDHAERSEYLNKFLPLSCLTPDSKKPYILITSRDREWEKEIEVLDLNVLALKDAVTLMRKGLKIPEEDTSQDQEIQNLVEKLQMFPLAIQQAAAYIADQRVTGDFSINNYLQEYEEKTKESLDSELFRGIDNENEKTTFMTSQVTVDKIKSNGQCGQLALKIFYIMALLAPDKTERKILLPLAEGDEGKLKSSVRLLVRYSFVNGEQRQSILSVHRLTQQVTRLNLENENKMEEIIREALKLRPEFDIFGIDKDSKLKLQNFLPHAEWLEYHTEQYVAKNPSKEQQIKRELMDLLVAMSGGYSCLTKKQKLLQRALRFAEEDFGYNKLLFAAILKQLGCVHLGLGDANNSVKSLQEALVILESMLGKDNFRIAEIKNTLSTAYGILGHFGKQQKLLGESLPVLNCKPYDNTEQQEYFAEKNLESTKTYTEEDDTNVTPLQRFLGCAYRDLVKVQTEKEIFERSLPNNYIGRENINAPCGPTDLAKTYKPLGDYQKQKDLLHTVLPVFEKQYGHDHVNVANVLEFLGTTYQILGDQHNRKEVLERALPIVEKHCGSDHINVANILVPLGDTYHILGDQHKQKEVLGRALPIFEKQYGHDHIKVANILVCLANVYRLLDDQHKAKDVLERALPIIEKHYGHDHINVANVLEFLGTTYQILGDQHNRKEVLERALPIVEKHCGSDHINVANILVPLGDTYQILGDQHKQKEVLGRALPIFEKQYGLDHINVANILVSLGNVYRVLGDQHKAKEVFERALPIKEKQCGCDHIQIADILLTLGYIYWDLDEQAKEKEVLERALPIVEKQYGHDHINFAITLERLGHVYWVLRNQHKAKELFERVLPIKEKQCGRDHIYVANVLVILGDVYCVLGNQHKAKEVFERALPIVEKQYGHDHINFAITLEFLGRVYCVLGDQHKAKEVFERALPIKEKQYGRDHINFVDILVPLGNIYWYLDEQAKGKEVLERALTIYEKQYGRDHINVAKILVSLRCIYLRLGDLNKAKEVLERALPIIEAQYGREHINVANILEPLGNIYVVLDDLHKAKEVLERALPIIETQYGHDHINVANILIYLVNTYYNLGDQTKRKEVLERSLTIYENQYGRDHIKVANILVRLANVYRLLDDQYKAKEVLERALPVNEKQYGSDHINVADILVSLGKVYRVLHNLDKAKEMLERALPICEKQYGRDHINVTDILVSLGNVYCVLGTVDKAKQVLERALPIKEKQCGRDHINVANILVSLGNVYQVLDYQDKAKEVLERALPINEKIYGRDHINVANILVSLGTTYWVSDDHDKAKDVLERALPINEKQYGLEHINVAKILVSLSSIYQILGDQYKVMNVGERALPIIEKEYGRDRINVPNILNSLGNTYYILGDETKLNV